MSVSTNGQVRADGPGLGETREHTVPAPPPGRSLRSLLWDAWKAYSKRAGSYQGTFLLSLVYYLILGPSTLLAGKKLLDLDATKRPSYWIEREPADKTLASLQRQF